MHNCEIRINTHGRLFVSIAHSKDTTRKGFILKPRKSDLFQSLIAKIRLSIERIIKNDNKKVSIAHSKDTTSKKMKTDFFDLEERFVSIAHSKDTTMSVSMVYYRVVVGICFNRS